MAQNPSITIPWLFAYARLVWDRIIHSAYFGYRLCLRDIRTTYSTLAFGLVWEFVEPLVYAVIFIFMFRFRALSVPALSLPYAVYVVSGMLIWQTFSESMLLSMDSIKRMGSLLGTLRVPAEALMLSIGLRELFNSLFRWAVIVGVVYWYGIGSVTNLALFMLAFPSIMIAGFAIGFMLAPFSVVSGDISTAVAIGLRPLMFLSGTLFPLPPGRYGALLGTANPAAVFIENLRGLAASGIMPSPGLFWGMLLGSVLLFICAWYVYRVCLRLVSWQT